MLKSLDNKLSLTVSRLMLLFRNRKRHCSKPLVPTPLHSGPPLNSQLVQETKSLLLLKRLESKSNSKVKLPLLPSLQPRKNCSKPPRRMQLISWHRFKLRHYLEGRSSHELRFQERKSRSKAKRISRVRWRRNGSLLRLQSQMQGHSSLH